MKRTILIVFFAFVFLPSLTSGCVSQKQAPRVVKHQVVPVPEIQYVDATIIEGKTTKQEVLDALGMADSISAASLSYRFGRGDKKYLHARLNITFKDGTQINVILGDGLQHDGVLIHFGGRYDSQGRHIPSNINTGISIS